MKNALNTIYYVSKEPGEPMVDSSHRQIGSHLRQTTDNTATVRVATLVISSILSLEQMEADFIKQMVSNAKRINVVAICTTKLLYF